MPDVIADSGASAELVACRGRGFESLSHRQFSNAFSANPFSRRFVQQCEALRDSSTTQGRAQFEAGLGIEIRQQNGCHFFNELRYANFARLRHQLEAGPLFLAITWQIRKDGASCARFVPSY